MGVNSRRRLHETIYREQGRNTLKEKKKRVNDILYRASKIIAQMIAGENVKPVMDEVTNVRRKCGMAGKLIGGSMACPSGKSSSTLLISRRSMA